MLKTVNDNLLCTAAQMLIDAKGSDEFPIAEQMLYDMLRNRLTARNIANLQKIRARKA